MKGKQIIRDAWRQIVLLLVALPSLFVRADPLDHWTTNQLSDIGYYTPLSLYYTNFVRPIYAAYGNGRFVAGAYRSDYGYLFSSDDGLKWDLRWSGQANPPTNTVANLPILSSLHFDGTRFLATGDPLGRAMAVSTNGIQWSVYGCPSQEHAFDRLCAVSYGQAKYVIAYRRYQTTDNYFYYSSDGTNWQPGFHDSINLKVRDIAYGRASAINPKWGFIAVTDSTNYFQSQTGTSWTQGSFAGGSSISFVKGNYIVPSAPGTNLMLAVGSPTLTWQAVPTGVPDLLGKISEASGILYARAGNYLATSTNGINWVKHGASPLPGTSAGTVASDGKRLVAVAGVFEQGPFNWSEWYAAYTSDPFVALSITPTSPPQLSLSGLVGRSYRIDYTDGLVNGTNNWQALTNLQLPSSPFLLTDSTATNSQRFYRAVLLP